jgi:hypothetical protein
MVGSTRFRPSRSFPVGCPAVSERASEKAFYRFHSPLDGEATATLSPLGGDLDLIVSGATSTGACDPQTQCHDASAEAGPDGGEAVTWSIRRGELYFLIIDDPGGGVGYSLSLTCGKL